MPGFLLHLDTKASCLHQGEITVTPGQPRVTVSGKPVATTSNMLMVAGCVFTVPGPKPQPCVRVQWSMVSSRITVCGQPVLLQPPPGPGMGSGICQSAEQIPQGAPTIKQIQMRVSGM